MARILLSDIPNAPSGPSPVLGDVPNVSVPKYPTDNRGVDMSGRASQLMLDPNVSGFKRGAALTASAGQEIGETLARTGVTIGRAMAEVQATIDHANNMANLSRQADMQLAAEERFQDAVAKDPYANHAEVWGGIQKDLDGQLGELWKNVSPSRRLEHELKYKAFQRDMRVEVGDLTRKTTIKNARQAIEGELAHTLEKGLYDQYDEAVDRAEASLLYSKPEIEKLRRDGGTARWDYYYNNEAQNHPEVMRDEALKAIQTHNSELFPELNSKPEVAARWYDKSRAIIQNRTMDAQHAMENDIASGAYKTVEDMEVAAKTAGIEPRVIAAYKARMEAADDDRKPNYDEVVQLRVDMGEYDPKTDPDSRHFVELYTRVQAQPKSVRGQLSAELWKSYERGKNDQPTPKEKSLETWILKQLHEDTKKGRLGPTGLDAKGKVVDPIAKSAASIKEFQRQEQLKQYIRDHPDVDETKVAEYYNEITREDSKEEALKAFEMPKPTDAYGWGNISPFAGFINRPGKSERPAVGPIRGPLPQKGAKPSGDIIPLEPAASRPGGVEPFAMGTGAKVSQVTGYRPGGTAAMGLDPQMEGGKLDRHGNVIVGRTTMEDYLAGRGDYVTVAMDKRSAWQGKYLTSPKFPGVVFRVMDTGSYGDGKGEDWIDIAWLDPQRAKTGTLRNVNFQVITPAQARRIADERA